VPLRLSFRWSPWDPGGSTHADRRASGAHRSGVTEIKKKSRSIFQVRNNKIS
jgi:hypothetical protein